MKKKIVAVLTLILIKQAMAELLMQRISDHKAKNSISNISSPNNYSLNRELNWKFSGLQFLLYISSRKMFNV